LQEIHGGMWSKGAWTWLKAKASSETTNNASKGVYERVWAVQLMEHTGMKVTKKDHHAGRKPSQGRQEATQAGRPRPAGLPYKCTLWCWSSAGKQPILLSVCVLEFLVQNRLRLSHPSQVGFAQKNHTLNPLKVHTPKSFLCASTPIETLGLY
jgi:hypothetical protein